MQMQVVKRNLQSLQGAYKYLGPAITKDQQLKEGGRNRQLVDASTNVCEHINANQIHHGTNTYKWEPTNEWGPQNVMGINTCTCNNKVSWNL